jgi:hypothetical protein
LAILNPQPPQALDLVARSDSDGHDVLRGLNEQDGERSQAAVTVRDPLPKS